MNKEIKHTYESRELSLFAVNDYTTYNGAIMPVIRCLSKKVKAGTFDETKAVKAFYNVATFAAKRYHQNYCDASTKYYKIFSTADRRLTAADLLDYYMEDITEE